MKSKNLGLIFLSLFLIFAGSWLAKTIHTANGAVEIQDLRFTTESGSIMSGLLYIPKTASKETPAPGVLAIHGYINSRETQSGFAIELSRRGFVVLAIDQSGHGYTDPPAFANNFGALDGLNYLRNLAFVDQDRIGLEGHSMGGWAVRRASQLAPEKYNALVMVGSGAARIPGLGDFSGDSSKPKNTAIIFSLYDEFANLMWEGAKPQDVPDSNILKQLFGSDTTIEVEKLYGDLNTGTARKFYQPATTHPGDHISAAAILNAVEWLQLTLSHESSISPTDSIFLWKEIGTLIAFIGLVLLFFPLTKFLIQAPIFSDLSQPLPANHGASGINWWLTALLATLVPAVSYFAFQHWGNQWVPANWFWPQNITTGIAAWALGNALITALLIVLTYFIARRPQNFSEEHLGFGLSFSQIIRTAFLSLCVISIIYAVVALVDWIFKIDFRFWVAALKLMSPLQFKSFVFYLPIFVIFFLSYSAIYNGRLRRSNARGFDDSLFKTMFINSLVTVLGLSALLALQYGSLFTTGTLFFDEALLTIVAIQFIPLLIILACINSYCFRLSGNGYLGAFINALFITWYIVAGQATHFAG